MNNVNIFEYQKLLITKKEYIIDKKILNYDYNTLL